MSKRTITLITISLGTFLLILVGAISVNASGILRPSDVDQQEAIYQATLAAYSTREAAYEDLIETANEQLVLANEALATLSSTQEVENTALTGLNEAEAIQIAQLVAAAPETLLGEPELVNFEGTIAYEVQYEEGAIYVSYSTGEILLNGTLTFGSEVNQAQAEEIARAYLGLDEIIQSDKVTINGTELFRVIFSVGHFVYIDSDGQIVYIQMYVAEQPTQASDDVGEEYPSSSNEYEESDDDDDEYEDEHDDEDDDEDD